MQLMDSKLQELAGQHSQLASPSLWLGGGTQQQQQQQQSQQQQQLGGAEREIVLHLEGIAAFFEETMDAMQACVLEPALIDGAFFSAFSTLNNRLSAILTGKADGLSSSGGYTAPSRRGCESRGGPGESGGRRGGTGDRGRGRCATQQ